MSLQEEIDEMMKITLAACRKHFEKTVKLILDPPNCSICGTKQRLLYVSHNEVVTYCPKCSGIEK